MMKFGVNGRVIINTALFKEKNPNYFFLSINEKLFEDNLNDDSHFEDKSSGNDGVVIKRKAFYFSKELLLCSETAYGFYFITKQ
jgi:hypothetical protein